MNPTHPEILVGRLKRDLDPTGFTLILLSSTNNIYSICGYKFVKQENMYLDFKICNNDLTQYIFNNCSCVIQSANMDHSFFK